MTRKISEIIKEVLAADDDEYQEVTIADTEFGPDREHGMAVILDTDGDDLLDAVNSISHWLFMNYAKDWKPTKIVKTMFRGTEIYYFDSGFVAVMGETSVHYGFRTEERDELVFGMENHDQIDQFYWGNITGH